MITNWLAGRMQFRAHRQFFLIFWDYMCRLRESSRVNSRDSKEGCRWKGGKNNNTFIMFQRYPFFTLVIVSKGTLWKWICVQLFDKERITFILHGNPHNSVQIPFINCVSVRIEVQRNRAGSSLDSRFCTTILFPFSGTSCWSGLGFHRQQTGTNWVQSPWPIPVGILEHEALHSMLHNAIL